MADRRYYGERQARGEERGRGAGRRDSIEGEHEYVRPRIYREEDRGESGRRMREPERGGRYGRGLSNRELGRQGRGYEYGGDEDRGRFDQERREEYRRGGLMRGTSGRRRAGGPGEEFGEGFWSEMTRERTRGDFNRYGDRDTLRTQPYDTDRWSAGPYGPGASARREDLERYGWGRGWSQGPGRDPGHGTRGWGEVDVDAMPPRTGYETSGTRAGDRGMGHGFSPELPRRGRGPRGYRRGDERIREDICDRLMQGWMDAEDVDIQVREGEVTLSGTVKSREEKRAIEDLAEDVLGVKEVHNEIRVAREQQPEQGEGQRAHEGRTLHS